jgi:hypothetical protein
MWRICELDDEGMNEARIPNPNASHGQKDACVHLELMASLVSLGCLLRLLLCNKTVHLEGIVN